MSQRSLVEINHDYLHDIAREPMSFVTQLTTALMMHDESVRCELKNIYGVTYIAQRHHSDDELVTAAIAKLREGVEWAGPTGRKQGQIVLDRHLAVALLAAFGIKVEG